LLNINDVTDVAGFSTYLYFISSYRCACDQRTELSDASSFGHALRIEDNPRSNESTSGIVGNIQDAHSGRCGLQINKRDSCAVCIFAGTDEVFRRR
jgi:hypothetical protein